MTRLFLNCMLIGAAFGALGAVIGDPFWSAMICAALAGALASAAPEAA